MEMDLIGCVYWMLFTFLIYCISVAPNWILPLFETPHGNKVQPMIPYLFLLGNTRFLIPFTFSPYGSRG
jgi:hypothetical protein